MAGGLTDLRLRDYSYLTIITSATISFPLCTDLVTFLRDSPSPQRVFPMSSAFSFENSFSLAAHVDGPMVTGLPSQYPATIAVTVPLLLSYVAASLPDIVELVWPAYTHNAEPTNNAATTKIQKITAPEPRSLNILHLISENRKFLQRLPH
jgi:hypothetical protein